MFKLWFDRHTVPPLILCALVLVFVWFVYRDTNPWLSNVADLGFVPDSVEYLLLAKAFASGRLMLDVNGFAWPIRYPPLLSALLAPLYFLFPSIEQVAAVAPVIIGCAGIVLGFYALRGLSGSTATALIFATFLATSPIFTILSWAVLAEPTMLLVIFIGLIFASREMQAPSAANRIALGTIAGALVLLKLQCVFTVFAASIVGAPYLKKRGCFEAMQIVVPFAAVASILPLYNYAQFGNPLMTGYGWQLGGSPFSLSLLPMNLETLRKLFAAEPVRIVGVDTTGLALGLPALALLGAAAIWRSYGWRTPAAICTFIVLSSLPFLFYNFSDPRFHIVLIVGVYGLAAAFFGLLVVPTLGRYIGEKGALIICVAAALAWPGVGQSSALAFLSTWRARSSTADNYFLARALRTAIDREGKPAAVVSALYLPVAAEYAGPLAKVYPLFNYPPCRSLCLEAVKIAFAYDIDKVVQSRRVYLSDVDIERSEFGMFCIGLAARYQIARVTSPSRWHLFVIDGPGQSAPSICERP